jgi:hypothetical protein
VIFALLAATAAPLNSVKCISAITIAPGSF